MQLGMSLVKHRGEVLMMRCRIGEGHKQGHIGHGTADNTDTIQCLFEILL